MIYDTASDSGSGDGVFDREMRPYTYSTKLKRIGGI